MYFRNLSSRNYEEVRELVTWALEEVGLSHEDVAVDIADEKHRGYRGLAYPRVPIGHPYKAEAKNLIEMWVGPDTSFPASNLWGETKLVYLTPWLDCGNPAYGDIRQVDIKSIPTLNGLSTWTIGKGSRHTKQLGVRTVSTARWADGNYVEVYRFYMYVYGSRPYGGKSAPFMSYLNWREVLVGVVAHEAQHIVQFRSFGAPCSEVQCERVADAVLRKFRRERGEPEYTAKELEYKQEQEAKGYHKRKIRTSLGYPAAPAAALEQKKP